MQPLWGADKATMEARNIVFQDEDKAHYVRKIFDSVTWSTVS
jgi:hypothetical protein